MWTLESGYCTLLLDDDSSLLQEVSLKLQRKYQNTCILRLSPHTPYIYVIHVPSLHHRLNPFQPSWKYGVFSF
ncbi:hypothetical protein CW304_10050 [Bacillus sp. UFRGS-B20]|nr:hypothetical protein CW304_10050 [Bacillus sp. UFRGS-B20]